MNAEKFFSSLFPLGSHLCREPMPAMSELKQDMGILKKNGFNLVKLQEHWMVDEPREGSYDFSKYEELIDHAAKLDMGVYLGLTCEQAPTWLYQKHPGCRMVGRNGMPIIFEAQTTLPADGKPGPCFDHPGALADQTRFITHLVECLGRFENLVVWNTWQEIAYWPMHGAGQPVCFCENTLNAFRLWLEQKYGGLDGLNRAWLSNYADWKYVQPDRGSYQQNGLPHDVDWRFFMDNVQVANVLRARANAIKAADPLQRPVFAHKGGMAIGFGQDWTYARTQDFLGSSCYPAWNPYHPWDDGAPQRGHRPERVEALKNEMSHGVVLTYDYLRSCNRPGSPLWAAEFQGGPISTFLHKGRIPTPADIRRWMLSAVSSGVTAISFWVTRAEIMAQETNGFSLLDSEGETTPRIEEAGRVGAALNRHANLFGVSSWQAAELAVLINEENAQLCSTVPPAGDHLSYAVRGWHTLLWEAGIAANFLDSSELDTRGKACRVIILPFPLSISEELAKKLAGYVAAGGILISEAAPGRLNEHNIANRGEMSPALRALFGASQQSLQMVREPADQAGSASTAQRWMPVERTWGEFLEPALLEGSGPLAGASVQANLYLQTFTALDSETVLTYGQATAGVIRRYGAGQAWLLGTYLGHSGTAYRSASTQAFIRRLLAACDIHPLHSGKLLLRKRAIPGKTAYILTNPGGEPLTETITVGAGHVEDLLGEPVQQDGSQVTLTVGGLDIRILIQYE